MTPTLKPTEMSDLYTQLDADTGALFDEPPDGFRPSGREYVLGVEAVETNPDAVDSIGALDREMLTKLAKVSLTNAQIHHESERRTYEQMKSFILLVCGLILVTLVYLAIKLMVGVNIADLAAGLGLIVEGSAVAFLVKQRSVAEKNTAAAARALQKMEARYRKLVEGS